MSFISTVLIQLICIGAGWIFIWRQCRQATIYALLLGIAATLAMIVTSCSSFHVILKDFANLLRFSSTLALLLMIVDLQGKITDPYSSSTGRMPLTYSALFMTFSSIVTGMTFLMGMVAKENSWHEGSTTTWFSGASTVLNLAVFWMGCMSLSLPYFLSKIR